MVEAVTKVEEKQWVISVWALFKEHIVLQSSAIVNVGVFILVCSHQ